MSSFPGRAFASAVRPVSAYSGRKEFIEDDKLYQLTQVDAVLSADTAAP